MAHILTSIPTINQNGNGSVPIELFGDNSILMAPEDWPNELWGDMTGNYNRWWSYYKGYVLNKKASPNGPLIYPMRLNIVRAAVINHAALLLGQMSQRIVQFGANSGVGVDDETNEQYIKVANLLWRINNTDSKMLEQALFQQIFGGFFFKVAWAPQRKKWPVRYYTMDPRACFPVWDGDDYDRIVAIDVMHQVAKPVGKARYNVEVATNTEYVNVREHWDEFEYFVEVEGRIARWADGAEMKGPNPFHDPVTGLTIVPYVYAPRIRVGNFFGESLIPGLIGPQDEINNNIAHLAEGMADAMHQQPWVRNRAKGSSGLDGPRSKIWDLGMTQLGQDKPEVGRLEGAEFDQAIVDFVLNKLPTIAREHINLPDVAWGKTDASVRSALTLHYMMWPSINVGNHYRINAARALCEMTYQALVVSRSKERFNVPGVSDMASDKLIEAALLSARVDWPPMLPQDRDSMVNEMVQRMSAKIVSRETAITRLDGSGNVVEELERISEDEKAELEKARETMRMTAEFSPKTEPGQGSSSSSSDKQKPAPKDRSNKAQAAGGRKSDG